MTEQNDVVEDQTEQQEENKGFQISIEQICAAILSKIGSVELELDQLLADYSKKSIAVNQDPETKSLTFELTDVSVEPAKDSE